MAEQIKGLPTDATRANELSRRLGAFAIQQLEVMESQLRRRNTNLHLGVHEARKSARRFRSVVALFKSAASGPLTTADRTIREVGKRLSRLRDAHVVFRAVSVKNGPTGKTDARRALRYLLKNRRNRLAQAALDVDPQFRRKRRRIHNACRVLDNFEWPTVTLDDLSRSLRQSAKRMRRAERDFKAAPALTLRHRWRRRVRRLRIQLQALAAIARDAEADLEASRQAQLLLSQASAVLPSVESLCVLSDALGDDQDRNLLRRILRRELESPFREEVLEALGLRRNPHEPTLAERSMKA